MSTSATVPIIDPTGTVRDVPYESMHDALSRGGKMGVYMMDPTGTQRVVPADQVQDASAHGGKVVPYNLDQSHQKEGFWSALGSDLKGMLTPAAQNPYPGMGVEQKAEAANQAAQQDQQRKAAGYSVPYRVIAPVAQSVGVNVPGMEQAAAQGDPGAVMGHATAAAAPVVTAAAVSEYGPRAINATKAATERTLLLGKTPEEAYQSALKPSTTLSEQERANVVNTGLQEGIPVSKEGLAKISDRIADLNRSISQTVETNPNAPVDPNKVATRVDQIKPRFANQVNAGEDLASLEASKQQFLAEQGAKPGTPAVAPKPTGLVDEYGKPILSSGTPASPAKPAPPMTARAAQAMKQGTYQNLGDKAYGELGTASIEAQKALARGLKEELVTQFPELKNLNAAESRLFDLQPVLERAVNRIGNHQLVGIGTPIAAGATKAVTGSASVGAVAGVLKAVLDNPVVKSRLAIAISKGGVPLPQAFARVEAYSTALGYHAQGLPASSSQGNPGDRTNAQP